MMKGIKSLAPKYKKIFLLVFACLILFYIYYSCSPWTEKFYSCYGAGPIQVFGNKHELWLFLEFERLMRRDRASWDVRRVFPHGNFQEIIILNKQGLKKRIHIEKNDGKEGVTFNFMISLIFEHNGEIYLYTGPSMNYRESLFKFNENDKRFELLPIEESDAMLNKLFPDSTHDRSKKIYEASKTGSWRYYYSDRWIGDDSFTWQGMQFDIIAFDDEPYFKVKIDINKPNENFPLVLTYLQEVRRLTYKDYKNIKVQHGHPK